MKKIFINTVVALLLSATSITFAAVTTFEEIIHEGKYPQYPKINYGKGDKAERIRHGEYLVKAGDCIACHTNTGGTPFAGGLPIKTPFGTIYSPNITPDNETGLGRWTDQQFIRAMREGVAPDGSYYFPVFPYPYFNKLSDQDVKDIKTYLEAIPPVKNVNKPLDMPWPFRWRFLQLGWRLLFFDFYKGEFQTNPRQSALWNRGDYLVEGLGHCGMCHTPMNFLGAPKRRYALTGGFVNGFYAPNISSTNLANTPVPQIVDVFLTDNLIGGGRVAGPMSEVNHNSLEYLTTNDLEAIATYVKSVKSEVPPTPKRKGEVTTETGKEIYNKYCVGCHGTGAGGAPKLGDKAAWTPRLTLGLNVLYKNAIVGIGGMPPKGTCATCTDQEIQAAVDYIASQSGGTSGAAAATQPKPPLSLPQASMTMGKQVYTKVCSTCHEKGNLGAPKVGDKKAWAPLIKQNMDVLFRRAITGYKGMPPRGACYNCSDTEIFAAIKYMVEQSKSSGNYSLW